MDYVGEYRFWLLSGHRQTPRASLAKPGSDVFRYDPVTDALTLWKG